jgi:copper chaperone CopZ
MKTLLTAALTLSMLFAVGCADGNAPSPETNAVMANATNKVAANIEGMDCSGCSSSVVAAVEAIDGVMAATADVATGDVEVALEDNADTDAKLEEIQTVLVGLQEGKYTVKTISASGAQKDKTADEPKPAEEPAQDEPAGDKQAVTEPVEEAFVFTSYKVTGMDCSGCSGEIESAVKQVPGVVKVKADHMTGAVKVSITDDFDDKKKTDEIKDLIAGLSDGKYTVSY